METIETEIEKTKTADGANVGVERLVKRQNTSLPLLIYALTGLRDLPNLNFNVGKKEETYGSNKVKHFDKVEWKNRKPQQTRNDICNCGSGKKYKKCCGVLSV
jgi:hypothetical protein